MPIEFGAAAYRFGHSMVRPLLPSELHQRHRRQHKPDRRPLFRAGIRHQRTELQRPSQP